MAKWTANDVPSQAGRLAIVTGTGGLGYETALVLAQHGAEVILAGRNEGKGERQFAGLLRWLRERAFDLSCWIWPISLRSPPSRTGCSLRIVQSTS